MSDNKSRDIFYGVVALATLIVAILGATLAYFSITARSNEGAVNAKADVVSISYNDSQQVSANADKLIPSSLDIVKKAYEKAKGDGTFGSEGALADNVCVDTNGRQVCSIYRFTVSSDTSRTMIATLNSELNTFTTGLSYALYDVNKGESAATTEEKEAAWIVLDENNNSKRLVLDYCNNEDPDTNKACYTTDGTKKTYNNTDSLKATNSLFGYTVSDGNTVAKGRVLEAKVAQVYDLVIFLNESGTDQNADQGKEYQGTLIVEVVDGTSGTGRITGEWK